MNTLRKRLTAIGLAGSIGLASLAIPSLPAAAASSVPNQSGVKNAVPQQTEDVRWRRRHVGPAVALGIFAAAAATIAAHQHHRRYHRHYYRPYYPGYYGYYGPRYYYYGGRHLHQPGNYPW
jgi:hypothetical protein